METRTVTAEAVELKACFSIIDLNSISSLSDSEITQFRDSRGFTALMIASEAGHIEAVRNLISRGEEVNDEVEGESAASLAFSRGHHEVVLTLLKANSKFPKNYQHETASDELKAFVDLSTKMHENVRGGNLEELQEVLKENFGIKYFFDRGNNSLLQTAIVRRKFEIYEYLLTSNIFLAPHESIDLLTEKMSMRYKRKFSEINFKLSPELVTEPMMILLRNCKLGPDNDPNGDYMNFTHKAFDFLFKIPLIAIVLKVVAAYRNFSIVFDFNRDSVTFLDPRADPSTNGLFYTSGKIFIAAKDMLDPSTAFNTIAVIAHELCHCAMLLVYGNWAKPYKENSQIKKRNFEIIKEECDRLKGEDKIISSVYEYYDGDMYDAELIVRVPQMLALYNDNEEILNEKRETFNSLFNYYEQNCVPEMEVELARIDEKFNPFIQAQKRLKKLRILIGIMVLIILCTIGGSVWGGTVLYNPTLSWSKLSESDKITVRNSNVKFHGVDVKLGELFANDSHVYNLLSSEQLKGALNNNSEALSKVLNHTLTPFVFLTWTNMTVGIKWKFMSCDFNFQGEKIQLEKIFSNISSNNDFDFALKSLNALDVRKIFNNDFSVSHPTEQKKNFFVERNYRGEKKKQKEVLSVHGMMENLVHSRGLLLSSAAGEGKTTTMRYFAQQLKMKYPHKWVQFVDLKKYSKVYKANKNLNYSALNDVSTFLAFNMLNLNEFERHVFEWTFKFNKTIFLWDGVDEIAPLYDNFILNLTKSIRSQTRNVQVISTRPVFSEKFQKGLNVQSFSLVLLTGEKINEFCIKSVSFENYKINGDMVYDIVIKHFNSSIPKTVQEISKQLTISTDRATKLIQTIEKSKEILKSIAKNDEFIENPLLIQMVTEIASDDSIKLNSTLNVYNLYEIFVRKKFSIVHRKGEVVEDEVNRIHAMSSVNIMKIHQAYAFKTNYRMNDEFVDYGEDIYLDDINFLKSIDLSHDEISRLGIIDIYSNGDFAFVHRTFADYLIVQYVIDSFSAKVIVPDLDDEVKVKLLINFAALEKYNFEKKLLNGFLSTEQNLSKILFYVSKFIQMPNTTVIEKGEYVDDDDESGGDILYIDLFEKRVDNDKLVWYFKCLIMLKENYENFYQHFVLYSFDKESEIAFLPEGLIDENYFHLFDTQDLFAILTIVDKNRECYLMRNFDKLKKPFELLDKFSDSQIFDLVTLQSTNNIDFNARIFSQSVYEDILLYWSFVEKRFDNFHKRKIIQMDDNQCGSAFYFLTRNTNAKMSTFMKKIVNDMKYSKEELRELLMKSNTHCETILFSFIGKFKTSFVSWLAKSIEGAIDHDKIALRKYLSKRNSRGYTIFSIFKKNEKIKIFTDLLKRTYENNMMYEKDLKVLEEHSRVMYYFEDFSAKVSFEDLLKTTWTTTDYNFFVDNWNKIKKNLGLDFKNLFIGENKKKENLIFHIARLEENESFIRKLQNDISKSELYSALTKKNTHDRNPLMIAAMTKSELNLKVFWNFYQVILNDTSRKNFLLKECDEHFTVLHYSAFNKDPKIFLFMIQVFTTQFSDEKVLELLLNDHKNKFKFIARILDSQNVLNFTNTLKIIYKDNKSNLQKIMLQRDDTGATIFNKFQNKRELKYFEDLLRYSFIGSDLKFKELLNNAKTISKFLVGVDKNKTISEMRDFAWAINDFEYLVTNVEKISEKLGIMKMKSLLQSKNGSNRTLLMEIVLISTQDSLVKSFLNLLESHLSYDDLYDNFYLTDNNGVNALMNSKNITVLWEFLEKYPNVKKKQLLLQKSKMHDTALQFSSSKSDLNAFSDTTKIYRQYFTPIELQKIYLDVHPQSLPFENAIRLGSMQRNIELVTFLKEIFKGYESDLLKLVVHRSESGYTIFGKFSSNDNIKIYKKLLKEVYKGKDYDKFLKYVKKYSMLSNTFNSSQIGYFDKEWSYPEFYYFVTKFQEIKTHVNDTQIKKMVGLHQNRSLLAEMALEINEMDIIEEMLSILESFLNKSEIISLIYQKKFISYYTSSGRDENKYDDDDDFNGEDSIEENDSEDSDDPEVPNENCLMAAALKSDEKKFKIFLNFALKYFNGESLKKLLLEKDDKNFTTLEYSMRNKNKYTFIIVKDLYRRTFTSKEIKEIILKESEESFITKAINDASSKTLKEVKTFLKEIHKRN